MEFVNELNVFKDIIADLSGVSVYLMALYVFTKAMGIAAWVYLGKRIIDAVSGFFKAGITKQEARAIEDENYKFKREVEIAKSDCLREGEHHKKMVDENMRNVEVDCKRQIEEIKHKYKILKESYEHKADKDV